MRSVFVHGACVRDGSWWWQRAAGLLADVGITGAEPALPSCGEGGFAVGTGSYADDVDSVRAVLTSSDEPTVVVAHSYGGIVVAEAAAGVDTVRHIVYISSYLPEPGESLATFAGEPAPFLLVDPDAGTFAARPEPFAETFMHDCPSELAAEVTDHLTPQTLSVTQAAVRVAGWRDVPTTYVVCTLDRGTPVARQREFARRADTVIELEAGHHPFLSRPGEIAEIVGARA